MVFPVGGSSSLGTWGYIEAMQEITEQAGERPFTDIAMVQSSTCEKTRMICQGHHLRLIMSRHNQLFVRQPVKAGLELGKLVLPGHGTVSDPFRWTFRLTGS